MCLVARVVSGDVLSKETARTASKPTRKKLGRWADTDLIGWGGCRNIHGSSHARCNRIFEQSNQSTGMPFRWSRWFAGDEVVEVQRITISTIHSRASARCAALVNH
jgi:hypothetical protein